jgi:signal peptidase I
MKVTEEVRTVGRNQYEITLTEKAMEEMKGYSNVVSIEKEVAPVGVWAPYIFPNDSACKWNEDNFGPLLIPKKGTTVSLNRNNLVLYERIIDVFEKNDLEIVGNKIYINGEEKNSYTFKMDYYWMMGDNRHNSADSRFWGFVPEDHVVGKAVFVWLSLDKNKSLFGGKIRWNKLFRTIN